MKKEMIAKNSLFHFKEKNSEAKRKKYRCPEIE
jgi:hypothetical protein